MKYLCLAYEEEHKLNELTPSQWLELRRETMDYIAMIKHPARRSTSAIATLLRAH